MKTQETKIIATAILILVLTISAFFAGVQPANAVPNVQVKTYAFIAVNPNPIGVNQPAQVSFWLADPPPTAAGITGDRWIGFKVTITKPDGKTETVGPKNSDAVGAAYFTYVPTSIGNYTFQMHYPGGQTMAGTNVLAGALMNFNNTYLASDSPEFVLNVQDTQVGYPPQTPIPSSFWSRPINGMNLEWTAVSGNWLMPGWNGTTRGFDSGTAFCAEGTAPNTAHVLWTKPIAFGGQVGGIYGSAFFHDGRSYEQYFKPPVVIGGRLYYNTIGANEPIPGNVITRPLGLPSITCVDMNNGQTLFIIPNATLSIGQIYNYVSPNQAGAFAYLWTTDWRMFDAWTGQYILTLVGVPGGTTTFGPNGEIIIYNLAYNPAGYSGQWVLSKWNSSKAIPPAGDVNPGYASVYGSSNSWQWRPYFYAGATINAVGNTTLWNADLGAMANRSTNGYEWRQTVLNITGQALTSFVQNGMYMPPNTILSTASNAQSVYWQGYSMKDGSYVFNSTLQVPTDIPAFDGLVGIGAFQNTFENNGIYYEFIKGTMQIVAYDVRSGAELWRGDPFTNAWGMYVPSFLAAYNTFYVAGFDGILKAYDTSNGNLKWTYTPGSAGFQTPYGVWPFYNGLTAADGKIFVLTGEHGNGVEPLYSGEHIFCVDAFSGKNIWNMSGWFEQPVIADSKMVSHNCYDNQIYCFGKGPTATTVEAPLTAVTKGSSIVIKGTVTDQSVGAKGTPAISDADMSEWMTYLYEQQSIPATAKGVTVKLSTIDPNGNSVPIGNTTSDRSGSYAMLWTPPLEGLYTVIATFEGSESYYGSYGETPVGVVAAPSTSVQPTSTPSPTVAPTPTASPTASPSVVSPLPSGGLGTEYFVAIAAVVIIIAIAAIAIVLRRRK
jgi:hypothetical protein